MNRIYAIGNAHLDPVWLWNWREGFTEAKALFRSALDRCSEDPAFCFSCSSSMFYEWVETNCPEMFEEIKARVAEGRIELAGGWVVQPDCNIPAGESFARHALYGQRYFQSRFGKTATTGYNVDSFGHTADLPQIYAKSGVTDYVFMRPMPHEKTLPDGPFWWRAPDGSQVLTCRIPYSYNTSGGDVTPQLARLAADLDDGQDRMFFYGVGNHGGGPTKENLRAIHAFGDARPDIGLRFARTDDYFRDVRESGAELPTVTGDLQMHAVGCYTVHARTKRLNRLAERGLIAAEAFSAVAHAVKGLPYPDGFEQAWKSVLFNQFHDILAGTSLVSAYEDSAFQVGGAVAAAQRNANHALQAISWDIDIPPEERMKPIVVFNPHAWAAKLPVEVELGGITGAPFKLTDPSGAPVPAQLTQSESVAGRGRLLFVADLPSFGYAVYKLYTKEPFAPEFAPIAADASGIETERYRLTVNPATGWIASLYDKANEQEVFTAEPQLVVREDRSDTWSHGVVRYEGADQPLACVGVKLVENGPVRAVLRSKFRWGQSWVTRDIRLYRALDTVELAVDMDWHDPFVCLKYKFPARLRNLAGAAETPYAFIGHASDGAEKPMQSWIDFSGSGVETRTPYGLSVLNDCKYGVSFEGNALCVTMLRNAPFAWHDPHKLDPDTAYRYTDEGRHAVRLALLPHAGDFRAAGTARRAAELNTPAFALQETYHAGSLPLCRSFAAVDSPQVRMTALKQAEDGDGYIARFVESYGRPAAANVTLAFADRTLALNFAPFEIKTVKIPYDAARPWTETDLLEREPV